MSTEPLTPQRQAAYDAVYGYIATLHPVIRPAERNAIIWRAVQTALDAAAPARAPRDEAQGLDNAAMQALSDAGAQCGDCGDQPGDRICPDCERCYGWYVAALRKAGWVPRAEVLREVTDRLANRATLYGSSTTVNEVMRDLDRLADTAEQGGTEKAATG